MVSIKEISAQSQHRRLIRVMQSQVREETHRQHRFHSIPTTHSVTLFTKYVHDIVSIAMSVGYRVQNKVMEQQCKHQMWRYRHQLTPFASKHKEHRISSTSLIIDHRFISENQQSAWEYDFCKSNNIPCHKPNGARILHRLIQCIESMICVKHIAIFDNTISWQNTIRNGNVVNQIG